MKLAKFKATKVNNGAFFELYCPECDFVRINILSMRNVDRSYQKAVILTGKCPVCRQKFKSVFRLN